MRLKNLIAEIEIVRIKGDTEKMISDVAFDSRQVKQGTLFVAIQGTAADGHSFISRAIESGASAVVCEHEPDSAHPAVTFILVKNSRKAIALIASAWYGHPSRDIKLVGITGTNGKTTIATLLHKVTSELGYRAGILSTIAVIIDNTAFPASHTTPDPLQINMWLRKMVDAGCDYCFMEVSSHAASQYRIAGLQFDGAVFTNLTRDHLDYHKDFREYLEAKKSFFDGLSDRAFALINSNDKNGRVMLQNCKASGYSYSLGGMSDFSGKILELHFEGMRMQINGKEIWVRLAGKFNAMNILGVYGVCMLLEHNEEQVLQAISIAGAVEGRFEMLKGPKGGVAIIDYAHTDDALKNVLETIQEVNQDKREVITVVGAGGDRDRGKRPKMGEVAARLSNKVILTSDNPRSESAEVIMSEMEQGIPQEEMEKVLKIADREEAIKTACMLGGNRAIILVAGKGHEKYQIIQGEKRYFDDKEVVKKYLN